MSINAISGFSAVPLHLVTVLGLLMLLGSIVLAIQTLINWFSGQAAGGFTTVILLQLLIGGCIMLSLGLIGIYIARIFTEVKGRPRYIIAETTSLLSDQPDRTAGQISDPAGRIAQKTVPTAEDDRNTGDKKQPFQA